MTEFKVGDKVRYVGAGKGTMSPEWIGLEGVMTESFGRDSMCVKITKSPNPKSTVYGVDCEIYPWLKNLEPVKSFTFKDIQAGDIIRRTCLRSDGSKVIWEGKVIRKNNAGDKWLSYDNYHLAYVIDDNHDEISLELLERPEPPHWTEAKPVGSMFLYGKEENKALWKKTTETGWTRTFLTSNKAHCCTNSEVKSWITEEQEWIK